MDEKTKKLQTVELERQQKRHAAEQREMQALLTELRDRLSFTELRLQDTRTELKNATEDLEICRETIAMHNSSQQPLLDRIQHLNNQLDQFYAERVQMVSETTATTRQFQQAIAERDNTLQVQAMKLSAMSADVRTLQARCENDATQLTELRSRLQREDARRVELAHELDITRSQADGLEAARTDAVVWRDEVQRLKRDVERLLQMLSTTSEWTEFAQSAQDSGGITYLGNPAKEGAKWIPEDAYQAAASFRHQHVPHVPAVLFETLLSRLNRVWLRRETTRCARIRSKYENVIKDLRRQLEQRNPYVEVVQQSRISFLRKKLADRDIMTEKLRKMGHGTGVKETTDSLLESALAAVQELSTQTEELQQENGELRNQLHSTLKTASRRDAFAEGAVWMGRTAVTSMDEMGEKVGQMAGMLRSAAATASEADLRAVSEAFLSKLGTVVKKSRDRVRMQFEHAVEAVEQGTGIQIDSQWSVKVPGL